MKHFTAKVLRPAVEVKISQQYFSCKMGCMKYLCIAYYLAQNNWKYM